MGLLDQVHSFAQGASNGVAGSLTGPVDGLAWLLRKAGVSVPQAPLGGSDWMRNVGLMQEPKERMAGLLGEGIGSALPTVIAGKAPQIANGLLQMERNAMAPRTLNPQTGAIVWHGSPHKFDKFDSSKIGTGEGAQAYGHGLYLAESEDVGRSYQQVLASPRNRVMDRQGVYIEPSPMGNGKYLLAKGSETGRMRGQVGDATQFISDVEYPNIASAIKAAKRQGYLAKDQRPLLTAIGEDGKYVPIKKASDTEALLGYDPQYAQFIASDPGHLYKVDLPDEVIAKMLDWDKPLSQQAPEVQAAVKPLLSDIFDVRQYGGGWGSLEPDANAVRDVFTKSGHSLGTYSAQDANALNFSGSDIVKALGGMDKESSATAKTLRDAGIPGIKYLDGGSRGAGAGTSNFVVFPGNEGLLKILERNGQGLLGN